MEIDEKLLEEAWKIVKQHKNFSPSFLQRKLSIGYNKARDMIEILREPYVLSLALKSKYRMRLVSKNKKRFR